MGALNPLPSIGAALLVGTAAILSVLALAAWRRSRERRHAVLALGFIVVFLAGVVSTVGIFLPLDLALTLGLTDAAIGTGLLAIYLAAVKR